MSEGATDYRLSCFSTAREKNIAKEKANLAALLAKSNSKRSDYELIQAVFRNQFLEIYDYTCSYCGVTMNIIGRAEMEIDHLEPKSGCEEDDVPEKRRRDGIGNLVLACHFCNHSKSDFRLQHPERINPDTSAITAVFCRDDDYYIRVSDKYDNDVEIKGFYEKLHLAFQIHRLDYILLTIDTLLFYVLEGNPAYSEVKTELEKIKEILSDSRRCQNPLALE